MAKYFRLYVLYTYINLDIYIYTSIDKMGIQSAENYIGKGKFYQRFKSTSSNLENISIYREL